jgi:DNA-binding SARP family transcriptional activator
MTRSHPSIAKICLPSFPNVLRRERLFRLLDSGRKQQAIWVSGPAGAGKTTLVGSYLDSRKTPCIWYQVDEGDGDLSTFFYYLGLAAKKAAPRHRSALPLFTAEYKGAVLEFSRRYFEKLFSRVKHPFVIVLDNYHHIIADSAFHIMFREALAAVPACITIIVISRAPVPPALVIQQIYNKVVNIGWDDLKFDLGEIKALLAFRRKSADRKRPEQFFDLTQGWAAGLVLLMERSRIENTAPGRCPELNQEELFQFFATEIFSKTDKETQEFLLKTSLLPAITPATAKDLTGNENAGSLLASFRRNHYFTDRRSSSDPVYQYHPLFREFLQSRAREAFRPEQLRELLLRAASFLEGAGRIQDAAELYYAAEDWPGFIRIVLADAMPMVSQGRSRYLEAWLKKIPESILDSSPWLLYWMGVCRMPFALPEGREYFEKAFNLFNTSHDASGIFLAWSGVAECFIQELGDLSRTGPWVSLLDALMEKYPVFPSPHIEGQVTCRIFILLSFRQPWHPAFNRWREKAMKLLENNDAEASVRLLTGYYLFTHAIQSGDQAACEHILGIINRLAVSHKNLSPLARGMVKMADAWLAWTTCSYGRCIDRMNEGLEISRESGVHLWDYIHLCMGICASQLSGDLEQSAKLLARMSPAVENGRPLDKFYYYHMMSCHCSLTGDIPGGISMGKKALSLAQQIGFLGAQAKSRLIMAHLSRQAGNRQEAREHIAECRMIGRKVKSELIEFWSRLSDACTAFAEGHEAVGMRALREAMILGGKKGFTAFNFGAWLPKELSLLCSKALEAGIETAFVREMIRKRKLIPEHSPGHLALWPWPLKVFTLGKFAMHVDDKPMEVSGKVQKKPLEMLMALAAFGGEAPDERIMEALWPDADGDTARQSFRTTLHRLRKLVGHEQALSYRDGRLGLDARYCWTDARAFEQAVESAVFEMERGKGESPASQSSGRNRQADIPRRLEQALGMYQGHFLAGGEMRPWALSLHERLKGKYLKAVCALGDCRMNLANESGTGKGRAVTRSSKVVIESAVALYEKALETDELSEELYLRLMDCQLRLGRKAEAARVYERCRKIVTTRLGVGLSDETEAMFRKIREQ